MPPKKAAPTEVNKVLSFDEDAQKPATEASQPKERKVPSHPNTVAMVREALRVLDSRKGATALTIRNLIHEKYPSTELVRLKYLVKNALTKGLESGVLMRPANSPTTGAHVRYRLSAVKDRKATENIDPNVKAPKAAAKGKAKEQESGAEKNPVKKIKTSENAKPKAAKGAAASKVAPAKKPKAKKPEGDKPEKPEKAEKAKKLVETVKKAVKAKTVEKAVKPKPEKASKADKDMKKATKTSKKAN